MENLRKFCAGDIIQRFQPFGSAVDIIRADHRANVRQRPVGNLAAVGERGQICFGVRIVIQFQRAGHYGHGFLPRDGRIGGHRRAAASVVSPHLHGHCNILVIPLVLGNILVLRNVRRFIATERAIDDCCHLCAGHISIRVNDGCALAIKQTVIHGRGHGFCIPRFCVIVLKICGFTGGRICRRCPHCQRQARRDGENHCEDSFSFHHEVLRFIR